MDPPEEPPTLGGPPMNFSVQDQQLLQDSMFGVPNPTATGYDTSPHHHVSQEQNTPDFRSLLETGLGSSPDFNQRAPSQEPYALANGVLQPQSMPEPFDEHVLRRYEPEVAQGAWPRNQPALHPLHPFPDSEYYRLVARMGGPTPPKNTKPCLICLEHFSTEEEIGNFPHKCEKCTLATICATCLKDWFLDACKNEAKMPPKCCRIIPLSSVSKLMQPAEIELYKAKYEEWNTPDRLYCPVPTCSTFIPPRLFTAVAIVQQSTPMQTEKSASDPVKPNVACPTCQTSICTVCRSFSHAGHCTSSDIDPELEGHLQRWNIQRCPKCRAGVRKVFGCAHVECRCGAHFCWECLKPMNLCDGRCEDEGEESDDQAHEYDDDDLDGNAGFHDGDGHEFGPEPYGTNLDQWACGHHIFNLGKKGPNSVVECQICFLPLKFHDTAKLSENNEDSPMTGYTTEPGWPANIHGEPAWQCVSGHIRCERCPKFPPIHRKSDGSWGIKCDCGVVCGECSAMKAEKERDLAWECHCGLFVCGGCKDVAAASSATANGSSSN